MTKSIFSITHSLDINKEFTNEIFMSIIIACKTDYASTAEEDAALNSCKIKYDYMIAELAKKAFTTGQKIGKKFGSIECVMSGDTSTTTSPDPTFDNPIHILKP